MAANYTATDVSNMKAALVELATRTAVEVEINGRRVKYMDALKLKALIDVIEADVNGQTYGGSMPVEFTGVTD